MGTDHSYGTHPIPPISPDNFTRIQHPFYFTRSDWNNYDIGIIRLHTPVEWEQYEPQPGSEQAKHFIVNTVCLPQKRDIPPKNPSDFDRWVKASYYAFGLMSISVVRSPFMQRGDLALKKGDYGFSLTLFETEAQNVPRVCGVSLQYSVSPGKAAPIALYELNFYMYKAIGAAFPVESGYGFKSLHFFSNTILISTSGGLGLRDHSIYQ